MDILTRGCHCCDLNCMWDDISKCGNNFINWKVKEKHKWWSDKRYTVKMWQLEVLNDYTRQSYWQWVNSKWGNR